MKVLVSDIFSAEGLAVFEEAAGIELDYRPGISSEELLQAVQNAEALVVRGGTQITAEVLDAAPCLRVVGRAGIGIENLDLETANRKGVIVMNTPFGSTTTAAEHSIAMLMALSRQIPEANRSTKEGHWENQRFLGVEINGKTLGVVGAGKIGSLVIEQALGLKMRVIVYDPYLAEDVITKKGAEAVDFDTLLRRSDFISLHVPLTAETVNLFDEEALARVKPGCRIINCAVGGLIDETALAAAIEKKQVAGAALDAFANEPPKADNPLLAMEQVICTPHLRTATVDAQINVTVQVARQIVDFLQKGIVANALNMPSINAERLSEIRPYLDLAERLGKFQAQRGIKGLQQITIEYSGGVTEHPSRPLTNALLKGLLEPIVGPSVNHVNAPHLARERGIQVVERSCDMSLEFANLIRLTVVGSDGESSVSGSLFGDQDYRIVRVDDHHVEAVPDGHILVMHNQDCPGVIGFIGQVFGESGINIAMMGLSRRKIQGRAISLITVDSKIPEEVLQRLRSNPHIISAVQVNL
ncbi:phosphoglycerate dehydrogenase [Syntrophotalea acetylenivorans]|uniref:D-3-phosphoglycerate dehydrogenase n=1 Tax=Syntrophotalea acetylenivorans TaxID=1842532 RepID=A0A1L3GQ66_9BACT|nr:phosphoglycerate dehydrogenase [Syntrophotalea acetylenivorans]APG28010.1 phosphoglycerate dehydrogenase [Syntrophotalea acetylenivorans]